MNIYKLSYSLILKMELNLNNNQVYLVIHRFYSNFKLRRNRNDSNPNQYILDNINKIIIVKIYYKKCIYSNDINEIKDNIVIIFKLNECKKEFISLNLLLENYKDVLFM
jgi:hypothetical protein